MTNRITYDWDSATVLVKVPTHHTATTTMTEVEIPMCAFADFVASHMKIEDGEIRSCRTFSPVLSQEVPDPPKTTSPDQP